MTNLTPPTLPTGAGPATVALVSLGCPKNLVDSERMLGLLTAAGLAVTDDHAGADAIVINTCGFLAASRREALAVIAQALHNKEQARRRGRCQRVVVAGCLVQRDPSRLLAEAPDIDALVGVFNRENIVQAVRGGMDNTLQRPADPDPNLHTLRGFPQIPDDKTRAGHRAGPRGSFPNNEKLIGGDAAADLGRFHPVSQFVRRPERTRTGYTDEDSARLRLTPRHYAYLRISEGCNQGCTFCTIPSIRGRMRSKPLAQIVAEAEELSADGAVEINLIGQDTTSYGRDIGYDGPGQGLVGLLARLDRLAGVEWFRLLYAYPSCFSDDMIRALAGAARFVKYIDLPLQHINDEILRAMRRRVTRRQIETLLDKLRRWIPGLVIRTTFITGFPGETEAQHRELVTLVRDFGFDCLGVFEYSPEPETPAGRLWSQAPVPAPVVARRREEIMLAQQEIVFRKNAALAGRTLPILIDQVDARRRTAVGRHAGQAPDIDGRVRLHPCSAEPGMLLTAVVEGAKGYDLLARPEHPAATPPRAPRPVRLPVLEPALAARGNSAPCPGPVNR